MSNLAVAADVAEIAAQTGQRGNKVLADQLMHMARRFESGELGGDDDSQAERAHSLPAVEEPAARPMPAKLTEFCSDVERTIANAIRFRRPGNGISSQELGALAEIDPRKARGIVAHLRSDHHLPIAGTPSESYFFPARIEDLDRTLASLQSRKLELDAVIAGIRTGAVEVFGTGDLFEAKGEQR